MLKKMSYLLVPTSLKRTNCNIKSASISPSSRRWPRRGGTMAATSTAGATSSMCAALTAPRPSLRIRLWLENYGFRFPTFFSSGDPQVRDQEHCGGCCCQGHLWGQRLHQVCSTPCPSIAWGKCDVFILSFSWHLMSHIKSDGKYQVNLFRNTEMEASFTLLFFPATSCPSCMPSFTTASLAPSTLRLVNQSKFLKVINYNHLGGEEQVQGIKKR